MVSVVLLCAFDISVVRPGTAVGKLARTHQTSDESRGRMTHQIVFLTTGLAYGGAETQLVRVATRTRPGAGKCW